MIITNENVDSVITLNVASSKDIKSYNGTKDSSCCSKYLHYFIPFYCHCSHTNDNNTNLEDSGFLQIFFFTWLYSILWKGAKKSLTQNDLGKLSKSITTDFALKKLQHYLDVEKERVGGNPKKMSFIRAFLNCMKIKLFVVVVLSCIVSCGEVFVTAFVIRWLLEFLETPQAPTETGFMWAGLLLIALVVQQGSRHLVIFLSQRIGAMGKAAVMGLIFEKVVRLKSIGNKSVGEIVNMCSNDSTRVFEMTQFISSLIMLPLMGSFYIIYLSFYFGPASLVGSGIMLIYIPFQTLLGRIFSKLREKTVAITDKRIKMISEVLVSIKLIKMYAWENPFAKMIYDLRSKERINLQKMAFVQGFTFSLSYVVINIAPTATFLTQVFAGQELNVPKAYTVIVVFSSLSYYIITCPLAVRAMAEVMVSFRRIKRYYMKPFLSRLDENLDAVLSKKSEFLDMEEHTRVSSHFSDDDTMVEIKNANFIWKKIMAEGNGKRELEKDDLSVKFKPDKKETTISKSQSESSIKTELEGQTLFDINFTVKKKNLIGICGGVGCGKSSLIQAILGEMTLSGGSVNVTESIAYAAQQAWIMNTTVRDNILFGKEYKESFYKNVCTACALDEDFKLLKSGDLTEIGERGVNLSGGQKQRISLARAVYSEKQLYLLDDPLSAVDSHVGKHIFEQCIKGALQKFTVIFVTHQLQYLKDCDYVYYMRHGKFAEQGTYAELINNNTEFALDVKKFQTETKRDNEKPLEKYASDSMHKSYQEVVHTCDVEISQIDCDDDIGNEKIEEIKKHEDDLEIQGKLIEVEEKAKGSVSLSTYTSFFKYAGGYFPCILVLLIITSSVVASLASEYWLSYWLQLKDRAVMENRTEGNVTVLVAQETDTNFYMAVYGGLNLLLLVVIIVSTFSTVFVLLRGISALHNEVFKKILASPMEFFDTTPIGRIVNRLAKDVDDIDNFLPWLTENVVRNMGRIVGSFILTAYIIPWFLVVAIPLCIFFLITNHFFRKVIRSLKRLDNVSRAPIYSYLTSSIQGLVTLRAFCKESEAKKKFLDLVDENNLPFYTFYAATRGFGTLVDFICIALAFTVAICSVFLKESVSPSLVGLSVVFMMRIIGLFQFTFRSVAEVEAKFTGVERLYYYVETLKPEECDADKTMEITKDWPQDGSIEFENVALRYRKGLPLVLKDFTLIIADKEKIGIVGRTGAGKSSIGVALYRIVNSDSGSIKIAGTNVKHVSLYDLRSNISIIPQDPILFIGTLRYNLDPFERHSDEELWSVLEKAHIKSMISDMPEKLNATVLENGANFSVGERQLICMARALLRKSKILMLDEATAAIDSNTDAKIQETIKDSFSDCTVLTIAHRLNTIMHCDKILVMEDGKVAEFDSPAALLSRDSRFKKMVTAANTQTKHLN